MAFDSGKSKLTKNNFGLGYSVGDFAIHGNVNDGQTFGGTVYQRVNPQLETGINLGWQGNSTNFGVGCKYNLDRDASVRAKVNNNSQIGLGYQQRLRDGKDCFLLSFFFPNILQHAIAVRVVLGPRTGNKGKTIPNSENAEKEFTREYEANSEVQFRTK